MRRIGIGYASARRSVAFEIRRENAVEKAQHLRTRERL